MGELAAGAAFGAYRIDEVLGRGGMGVVYQAHEAGLGRQVALKVIAPRLLEDDWARMQFVREARLAASLEHPNVMPIYAAGEHDGIAFLAMRLVGGSDLHALVAHGGPVVPERAVAIASQLAAALDAAHAAGLVHRDVKPANVLVTADGHVYLTDFGLAQHARTRADELDAGNVVGTVGYIAPEVAAGGAVDARAEVYALGCVLFFALAGAPPFRGDDRAAVLEAHRSQSPPRVSQAGAGVPEALDPVLLQALAKDPAQRQASAGELAAAARWALADLAAEGVEPLSEAHDRDLMRRLVAADDRAGALAVYERLAGRLRAQLGIVPSAATRQLATELRSEGAVSPAGDLEELATETDVLEPVGAPADSQRPPLPARLAAREGAFVGRADALGALEAHWTRAAGGTRGMLMVAGDAGIGKSRLVAEFARRIHPGATVLLGECFEESFAPYQPFVDPVRTLIAHRIGGPALAPGPARAALARLVPELDRRRRPREELAAHDREGERLRLFEAVAELIRSAAGAGPEGAVLVLEDLHWIDEPSAQMLRHLARVTEGVPLLVLGTCRDLEVGAEHPLARLTAELRRGRALHELDLRGLDPDEVQALVADRIGSTAGVDPERLHERTRGNPYFVEELLRADTDAEGGPLPGGITDLIERRLTRLGESSRRLASVAAVVGSHVRLAELIRVTGLAEDEVLDDLEAAIGARVLEEVPGEIGHFAFAHALVRETVYSELSATRRARLHLAVAEALEEIHAGDLDVHAAALAHHFSAAGDLERGFEYHARAAAAAERLLAAEAASDQYGAALAAGERLGLTLAGDARMRALALARGQAMNAIPVGAALDVHRRLVAAARTAGDRRMEMQALNGLGFATRRGSVRAGLAEHEAALAIAEEIGDAGEQVVSLSRISLLGSNLLEFDLALETAERGLAIARDMGDAHSVAGALDSLKLALLQLGQIERLEAVVAELEALHRRAQDTMMLAWTLQERAYGLVLAGRAVEAPALIDEGLAAARRAGARGAEGMLLDALASAQAARGAHAEALAAARAAVEILEPTPDLVCWSLATLGRLLLDLRAPEAGEPLERGLAVATEIGARGAALRCAGSLARARLLAGDAAAAAAARATAERLTAEVRVPEGAAYLFGAHAYAALAHVQAAAGEPQRALETVRPVAAAAAAAGAGWALGPLRLAQGAALLAAGDAEGALIALDQAEAAAEAGGFPRSELDQLRAQVTS